MNPSPGYVAAITRTGLVRKRNEDSAYVGRWMCAVADGMGGHAAGDVASATVIDAIRPFDIAIDPRQLTEVLGTAVREANNRLAALVQADPNLGNMGSTLTAMLWSGNHMALANIGDSRAYMLRNHVLVPITEDHVLSKLVSNPMPPQIGEYLVRFLDKRPGASPDLSLRIARPGDRYLLCSDGLSSVLDTEAIREVLAGIQDLSEAAGTLAQLTYQAGAPDNITAIIVDVPDGKWHERAGTPIVLGAADTVANPG